MNRRLTNTSMATTLAAGTALAIAFATPGTALARDQQDRLGHSLPCEPQLAGKRSTAVAAEDVEFRAVPPATFSPWPNTSTR